jgi:opacity protein-like surface antigen
MQIIITLIIKGKTMKKFILAAVLSTTALSAAAYENSNGKDYYGQVNAGFAKGVKPGKSYNGKMGNSGVFGIEAGYNVNNNFRASLSMDYTPSYKAKDNNTATTVTTKVKSFVTMINLYADITNYNGVTPYLTAGLGVARNKTNTTTFSDALSGITINGATKTNAAFKVGFGAKYAVNGDVDLDIRYQYVDAGKFNTGKTVSLNGASATADTAVGTGKVRSNQILVGAAYKF